MPRQMGLEEEGIIGEILFPSWVITDDVLLARVSEDPCCIDADTEECDDY